MVKVPLTQVEGSWLMWWDSWGWGTGVDIRKVSKAQVWGDG